MLAIDSLTLGYGGKVVVADASFTLAAGEIGSLLGPSGCGKSTLLRAIAGFERPLGGTVSMSGALLSTPETVVEPERRQIGMVFQDVALFPHLDVGSAATSPSGCAARRRRRSAAGSTSCWRSSGWRATAGACRTHSPAASSSAWPWRGRWRRSRRSC